MQKILSAFDDMMTANKVVKADCPDNWREKMRLFQLMILEQMKYQRNILFAAIIIADKYSENDNTRRWIYATAVEMIEGELSSIKCRRCNDTGVVTADDDGNTIMLEEKCDCQVKNEK